jgi:hypothetical protein
MEATAHYRTFASQASQLCDSNKKAPARNCLRACPDYRPPPTFNAAAKSYRLPLLHTYAV